MNTCQCGRVVFGYAVRCKSCAAKLRESNLGHTPISPPRRPFNAPLSKCAECGGIVAHGYTLCAACDWGLTKKARREKRK